MTYSTSRDGRKVTMTCDRCGHASIAATAANADRAIEQVASQALKGGWTHQGSRHVCGACK